MKRDTFIIIGIVVLGLLLYGLTLRGAPGNPTVNQFKDNLDQPTRAFELSPERGRYVHIANMAEFGTFNLTKEWAAVAYPDVGVSPDGRYYSFFAPGVSYFALPFYLIGAKFNLAQVASFSVESLVSIITLITIYLIGIRVFNLPRWAALFAVLVFGFGSTSWSYATTLYQNAFTACFMVTGTYAAWRFGQTRGWRSWGYATYVWLAYALSIWVDYPNAVLMIPTLLYLAYLTFSAKKSEEGIEIGVRWVAVCAVAAFIVVTGLQLIHNAHYYGGATTLAGSLQNYNPNPIATSTLATSATSTPDKSVAGFFHDANIPNSFYVLLFSSERGLLYFSPIFILSFLGIAYMHMRRRKIEEFYWVMISLVACNIFLYSSWGDPWGGWAFGPRYLIISMPWLALCASLFLASFRGKVSSIATRAVAFLLFAYSVAVSLVGALTSNAVPPKSEAILLPIKEYNYLLNIHFLQDGKSSSFLYNTYFSSHLSLVHYYAVILSIVLAIACIVLYSGNQHVKEH